MSKYQFKASIMCEECGEIHAEKWLTSANRHATTTTLWVLCDSCKENELRLSEEDDFDPFDVMEREHNSGDVCFLCTKPWSKCECFNDKEEN